jgi:N-acylglucosamine 2-epimerase
MTPPAGFYRQQIVEDCLPFWFPRAVDGTRGGFPHCSDHDGLLLDDDQSVWADDQ